MEVADAKYVVDDHRNGDAKIELEANKREFSGLTKEELMKYADDPFWVNLRWSLFVLFWAAWLCMLAGAIVIIVQAPKCVPPEPRKWYEQGPLVELKSASIHDVEPDLPLMQSYKIQGVFIEVPTYDVLDQPDLLKPFKAFFEKAKNFGIKVVTDLTPNFVSLNHTWFKLSENRTEPYTNYFLWAPVKEYNETGHPKPPNTWVPSAWTYSDERREFYLHQDSEKQPDLNFSNSEVVANFDKVITTWITAGASGIRLLKTRQLIVDPLDDGKADLRFDHTNQRGLYPLLQHFGAQIKAVAGPDPLFTIKEDSDSELSQNVSMLSPVVSAPLVVSTDLDAVQDALRKRLPSWPAIELVEPYSEEEIAAFSLLLPATPIFQLQQLKQETNETLPSESLTHLVSMREDVTIAHGEFHIAAVPPRNATLSKLLVCARWKAGHTGYVAVYNPWPAELHGNLSSVESLPDTLTVHHVSHQVKLDTNFTSNFVLNVDDVLVSPRSTVILSYVPKSSTEQ